MSHIPRRGAPHQAPKQYAVVPTSPRSAGSQQPSRRLAANRPPSANGPRQIPQSGRAQTAMNVARGAIGMGYGPYSYHPTPNRDLGVYNRSRFSGPPSSDASASTARAPEKYHPPPPAPTTTTVPQYIWDKDPEVDDSLHNPDPRRDARLDRSCDPFSMRGWANAGMIFVIVLGLLTLFAGYPIIVALTRAPPPVIGWNIGGINGSGQIPDLPFLPTLIDSDTPSSALSRTGTDGEKYNLVFSDEFNQDGRSFYPGDDPFWEAVDLHYWPTGDLEWYDPSAVTTANGKLVITVTEQSIHDLNFKSGMVTSWNKICFNTGYVEVSVSMPGSPTAPGLWPGIWSLGNLGRAGYGATTEGMWPYSYDTCDLGTFPNQTAPDGTPAAAATGGLGGGPISYMPGQRLSACTCPGSDHPGPSVNTGRGVPEIDILETQVDLDTFTGQVSQSMQVAPYNYQYNIDTSGTNIYDSSITTLNTYTGGVFQQAISAVSNIDSQYYNDNAYAPYAFEWWSNPSRREEGYITWFSNGQPTWTVHASAIGADPVSQVSERLISEEPMYLIFNLGLSPSFQKQDFKHLQFPSKMYIDYVRVYQRDDIKDGLTCDPSARPTADYISRHMDAYTNPNLTTWSQANYTFPRNSKLYSC